MDSRFARLRQRDASVEMLRVKVSRRRSLSQKENRERTVNTRRQLDQLPELEVSSLNASIAAVNISTIPEGKQSNAKSATNAAQEERLKRLERWKEQKALEKEKEKRAKELKGVFKTGLFQPKDTLTFTSLPVVPPAPSRLKEKKVNAAPCQSTRVTRSRKQQQEPQKPLAMQHPNTAANRAQPAAERLTRTRAAPVKPPPAAAKPKAGAGCPAVPRPARAFSTRSASRTLVTKAPVVKDDPKSKAADVRTTRSKAVVKPLPPSSGEVENCKASSIITNAAASAESEEHQIQEPEKNVPPEVEDMMVDQPPAAVDTVCSFAPEGFVFQAPAGLSCFKFEPMTPRSVDAFLTPSSSFSFPPAPDLTVALQPESSGSAPPETPGHSRPCSPPTVAPPTPEESKHDVPYFRSEITNETDRLSSLCLCWESKVEDESIPEEMRDAMRTAVGQARLLMKERFKQFSGLVDDCELRRGEKITTCMDLQGFWDMVYFQVEDVNKKFDALKEAEGRGWVEEHKPPPRQRKGVKKPVAASAKPAANKAAARSRLAAVKAAMKAKQQEAEAERAAEQAADNENSQEPQTRSQSQDNMLSGGDFKVESPAKPPVRRSSRLSSAVLPQASPSSLLSPRRITRRSVALAQTPVGAHPSPARPVCPPEPLQLFHEKTPTLKFQRGTPRASHSRKDTANASLCFSPVKEVFSEEVQPEQNSTQQSEPVSMQEEVSSAPDLSTSIQILQSTDEKEDDKPADLPLSPRLSLSLCKTPPPVLQAPEPPSDLSFRLTPCVTPAEVSIQTQQSACHTPDGPTTEELPGLDFERYLQPSHRYSASPVGDVEMESPREEPEELLMQQEPAGSSVLTLPSHQIQTAESDLLLFTPDLKDRIRPSVCPSDLMVFTPPSSLS